MKGCCARSGGIPPEEGGSHHAKDRGKGQRSTFLLRWKMMNTTSWGKFGGIAPIPPVPVEGQRSRVKVKGQVASSGG